MTEKIENNGKILAIIIGSSFKKEGIEFFTPDSFSQQLGYMNRKAGYTIAPHSHNQVDRTVTFSHEVLFIRSGKVQVDFYNDEHEYLENRVLSAGDVILLASGGHGFHILEDAEMIEVKQGPFVGEEGRINIKQYNGNPVK